MDIKFKLYINAQIRVIRLLFHSKNDLTLMPALAYEAAVMLGWSSRLCRGTAVKRTLPGLGRRSVTPSELLARLLPAPQNHFHAPVRRENV